MLDRLWWFAVGLVLGVTVAVRALRRTPRGSDLRAAGLQTGAEVLRLTARLVRPGPRLKAVADPESPSP